MSDSLDIEEGTIHAVRRGDPNAFAELVRRFDALVRGIVRRYWSSEFEREEAMQEIWTQVWKRRETLDATRADRFPAWLARLAHNRAIDLLRAEGRVPPGEATDPATLEGEALSPSEPSLDPAERAQLAAAVEAFAAELSEPWRRFFELHFLEGRSHRDCAEALSIPLSRAKYLKRRLVQRALGTPELLRVLGREGGPK